MNDKFIDAVRTGKLKGRTRIILEDVVTRHRQVVEDQNMMTSALSKLFETNFNGTTDVYNLMPLKNLLGGCFLFADPLTESVDNIFPANQAANRLTGHAGQTSHSTASTTRGNPNGTATVIDPANGLIKFVWDWTLEQGNGVISAVSLTSPEAGDCGLYPDGTLPLLKTFGSAVTDINSFSPAQYQGDANGFTLAKSKRHPMLINANGTGVSVFVNGSSFTENTVKHPFVRPCLIEGPAVYDDDNYTVISTRTATLSRAYTANYTVVAQDDTNYYILERDSSVNTRLYLNTVAKSDFSVTSQTIDITGTTLSRNQFVYASMYAGIVSAGYIYWVSGSDAKTFVRINISTPADVTVLTSYMSNDIIQSFQPLTKTAGLIIGANFLINGDYVYPVLPRTARSSDNTDDYNANGSYRIYSSFASYKNGPAFYQSASYDGSTSGRRLSSGPVLYLPYLATINNLQTPVTKTQNKTCRVEYSLTTSGGS